MSSSRASSSPVIEKDVGVHIKDGENSEFDTMEEAK